MIVILFGTKLRDDADLEDYEETGRHMDEFVRRMPGFISVKQFVAEDGDAVTIARFESEEALDAWRTHPGHLAAQKKGREKFYDSYWVQVCKTLRDYQFSRDNTQPENGSTGGG